MSGSSPVGTGLCAGVSGAVLAQPWLELVSRFLQNPLVLGIRVASGCPSSVDACSQAGKQEGDWEFGSSHRETCEFHGPNSRIQLEREGFLERTCVHGFMSQKRNACQCSCFGSGRVRPLTHLSPPAVRVATLYLVPALLSKTAELPAQL